MVSTRSSETEELLLSGLNGLTWTLFLLGSSKGTLLNTAGIFNRPHTDKSVILGRGSLLLCQRIMSTEKDENYSSDHCLCGESSVEPKLSSHFVTMLRPSRKGISRCSILLSHQTLQQTSQDILVHLLSLFITKICSSLVEDD